MSNVIKSTVVDLGSF